MNKQEDIKLLLDILDDSTINLIADLRRTVDICETMEMMLNNAIKHLLNQEQWGGVWLCRFNNKNDYCADITFTPSNSNRIKCGYIQMVIGEINFKKRKFSLIKYQEDATNYPNLFQNLRRIFKIFNLKESK